MAILFSVLWLLCCQLLFCLLLAPSLLLLAFCINSGHMAWFFLALPLAIITGLLATFATVRLFYLLIPNYPPGQYRLFNDKGAVLWAINNAPATLLLKWLQGTLFLNDPLRYLMLKSLGCDVRYSSWITSNVHLSDLRHIHIGSNTLIGEMCFLSPAIQTRRNKLKVAPIVLGDDVMVGYKSEIGPGCYIGDGCQLQSRVTLTINNQIGKQCTIGAGTVILPNVKIGNNVSIGIGCIIHSRVTLADNSLIPDGQVIHRHE